MIDQEGRHLHSMRPVVRAVASAPQCRLGPLRASCCQPRHYGCAPYKGPQLMPKFDSAVDSFKVRETARDTRLAREKGLRARLRLSGRYLELRREIGQRHGDAAGVLKDLISRHEADADSISICLKALPRATHRAQRQGESPINHEPGLGTVLLDYIWSDQTRWTALIAQEASTLAQLCRLAVLDGQQELLESWLEVDTSSIPSDLLPCGNDTWRGLLFRSLIQALLEENTSGSADLALECFFRVTTHKDSIKASFRAGKNRGEDQQLPGVLKLRTRPAALLLSRRLQNLQKTSPSLYDDFIRFHSCFRELHDPIGLDAALLRLYHPSEPRQGPLLRALRKLFPEGGDRSSDSVYQELPVSARTVIGFAMRVARDIARTHGHAADETWLTDMLDRFSGWNQSTENARMNAISSFSKKMNRKRARTAAYQSNAAG